jgi:TP901 family phage tail tape measure protein
MFEAGAIAYRLQAVGAEVFQRDIDGADRSMDRLGKTSKTAASNIELSGKRARDAAAGYKQFSADTERAMNTVGTTFIGAGLAVAAMVALSVVKFASYDKALAGLNATTRSTDEELANLGDTAIDAGRKFGYSANEAIEGEEALAKAGVTTAQILGGALTGSLTLAAAGELAVGDAAEVAAIAMVQFKKDGAEVPHIADLIAAGAGKAVGDVSDLAMALRQGGLVSSQFGVSLEETVGTLSAFAAAGLVGSDAGTSYKQMLLSLAAPQGNAAKLMKDLGINAYDATGKFIGIEKLAGVLKTQLAGLSAQQRQSALSTIFGSDAIRAASVLYEQGSEGIRQWTEDVNDSGYAARQAADRLDNLEGDVGKLSAALDRDLIKSGSAANDTLRDLVQSVTALADWYGNLPAGAQSATLAIGVGTAAVLLFSGAVFLTVPRIAAFSGALKELKLSMGQVALRGGAIGLVLTGLTLVLGAIAGANAEAAAKTTAYGDTIDTVTGKITGAARDIAKANLSTTSDFFGIKSDSTFDAASKIGLGLDLVTDAATGNAKALKAVKEATADYDRTAQELRGDESAKARYEALGLSAETYLAAIQQVRNGVAGESASIDEAIRKAKQSQVAGEGAADSNDQLADSYNNVSDEVDGVVTSLQDLAKEIDAANNAQLDEREAARRLQETYDDFDATIKKNGKTLDIHTEKGRENEAALDAMAKAALTSGDAVINAGGDYDDYRSSLESSRKAILDRINDLGLSGQKAEDLADKILKIPSKTEFEVLANVAPAEEALKGLIDGYSGKTIYLNAKTQYAYNSGSVGGIPQVRKADGGIVKAYASGGIEHHGAQIAKAGTIRIWNEPETGGEAYIPLTPAKRPRATQVLAQVADEFGYQLVPSGAQAFADGGATGANSLKSKSGPLQLEGRISIDGGLEGMFRGQINDVRI